MPELAIGALLFLRGDVEKARSIDQRSYSEEQIFDSMLLPPTDRPYFTEGFPCICRCSTRSVSPRSTAHQPRDTSRLPRR